MKKLLGEPRSIKDEMYIFEEGEKVEKTTLGIIRLGVYYLQVYFNSEYKVQYTMMDLRD